ncbi:MAG: glutamyl-tRNA reductase, partial [Oxalobacteraceae bacterium]|nr:glutamyl-tRNA reductase [Oxalobacteraceae bacterium]
MQLIAVGLNHTTAPLSLREKVAFPADQLGQAVASACAWFGNTHQRPFENAILSTCNRTEIYGASANDGDIDAVIDQTAHFVADFHKLPYA